MSKADRMKLEEAIKFLKNVAESQKELEDCKTTAFYKNENKAIETTLNYIDNSISKEVIEKKIEILKMEEHYDYIDNKKAITVLQEILEGK